LLKVDKVILDQEEFKRWLNMAKQTLKSAKLDLEGEFYNWACFKSHQSAEYAVKALIRGIGEQSYGHSVYKLLATLNKLRFSVPSKLISFAKTLDQYYTPTRYPDVWIEGVPYEYYSKETAEKAIEYASRIINWVEETWRKLSERERN